MARGIDLVIGMGTEVGIGQGMLGPDGIAEIGRKSDGGIRRGADTAALIVAGDGGSWRISVGRGDVGVDVEQLAHQQRNLHVEVVEKLPSPLEKGVQVVGVILKEGRLAVGCLQGIPVQPAPLAVVADAYVARERFVGVVADGYGERLRPVGCGDDTAVAVGLLHETVHPLDSHVMVSVQLLIPLHRTEIGGSEQSLPPSPSEGGGGRAVMIRGIFHCRSTTRLSPLTSHLSPLTST